MWQKRDSEFLITKSLNMNHSVVSTYFFRNLYKLVVLPLPKLYIWGFIEINCIGLSNEFGTTFW